MVLYMPISMHRCRRALILACQVVVGANANVRRARLCVLGYGQPPVRPVPESSSHSMRTTCGYEGVLAPVGLAVVFLFKLKHTSLEMGVPALLPLFPYTKIHTCSMAVSILFFLGSSPIRRRPWQGMQRLSIDT